MLTRQRIRSAIFFLIGIILFSMELGYAQPRISKEKITMITPAYVRKEIEKLYSSDPIQRGYAAINLGNIGKKRANPAVPFLIGMFHDNASLSLETSGILVSGTSPAQEAMKTLWKIGVVKPVIAALKDKDSDVRSEAAQALGQIKDSRAVEPLIAALKDKDADVRIYVVIALREIKDIRAVVPLITALKDENRNVREWAAIALGQIKDIRAVVPLITALKDENRNVRSEAAQALARITEQRFGREQARWQQWWDENKDEMLKGR